MDFWGSWRVRAKARTLSYVTEQGSVKTPKRRELRRKSRFWPNKLISIVCLSFACLLLLPKSTKVSFGVPWISQKRSSTLNDLLQATMLRIRATNRTIVGYVRCARFPQMQALASSFACGQPAGVQLQGNACDSTQNPLCKLKRLTKSWVFLVYHKGFVADRRNSEVTSHTVLLKLHYRGR